MIRSSSRLILLLLALAGCDAEQGEKHASGQSSAPTYMLYSPNGEPLNGGPLGKPTCEQALSGWFARVSAGGGHISQTAFLSDAKTQFARMDIDRNGYIVSEELDRFREPYRQQPAAHRQEGKDTEEKEGQKQHGHKGKDGKEGGADSTDLSFTTADPVMSADTNLDFKVTPAEFLKQAQDVYARLDANHDGSLDLAEVTAQCKQKQP